jgi:hypothetical protein
MTQARSKKLFVVCVNNEGYQASLEPRKIYQTVPDRLAGERGLIRVIDESGESYLYPKSMLAPIDVPKSVEKSLPQA